MAQTREEILSEIEHLKSQERTCRAALNDLSDEYHALLAQMRESHRTLETLERKRLQLEASLTEIKVCKPSNEKSKKSPTKNDILQAIISLSASEREELKRKLLQDTLN